MKRFLPIVAVLVVGYLIGARFPALARRVGL